MLWIAITGGIATGKTTVSEVIRGRGFEVLDADVLAREVVVPGSPALVEIQNEFGADVLLPNGELDRAKLGKVIFADSAKRKKLEAITHPRIRERAEARRQALEQAGVNVAFYDVPLLYEKNLQSAFDRVVVVACSRALQLVRMMKRDRLPKIDAEQRLNAQISIDEKMAKADDVIMNEGSAKELDEQVDRYLGKILKGTHQAQT